ncbi:MULTISPECIES: bifunctional riboflavin kinase/FAD synthetase [Auritidibacter]|uniref:bifunctional riboflavin kinase/FAD synthetase n=1 Tax=Auritidibacter TaxID=1160973 RepID=UPI000D73893D|nr:MULTISPECIES: bifunctional riboflavin kinase/FAD synthetase [Auritidibacter]PXA76109.1 bifunctional riboflavin kinase/FAD synthetase [Auritidibacter sp. NML120779]AXR73819.1 bifunctional riboflavin kinase/FAD synthetase [Auritidibacter sp. NML130574]PXA78964.1 bifunctional riboflavin kinase/FAD synthetase [Auritidibacter sp. NML120636]RMX23711.1 bifunctional riboflavin kinase/FAD synthetase [Auritidibacter ignavus]WGH82468.1 bifunctional riboflavin kinase/FAD synthetase [Auritidibacter igna
MEAWQGLAAVPAEQPPSAVTMGNFDGVHRGHQEVLTATVDTARDRGLQAVVLTFDPHPRLVHHPEEPLVPIVSLPQRLNLIQRAGADATCVVHYTLNFASQSPEEYVRTTLVETFNAQVVVVGSDCRFGKANAGDITTLRELGATYGFEVVEVPEVGTDSRWSSTSVRQALSEGRVADAATILGRPHEVCGEVVHGEARGRELGFPTANLSDEAQGMIPADGVYAGWFIDQDHHRWPTAISVGSNPTFEGVQRTVEAHIMNRPEEERVEDFDLYGQIVTVEFVARLRGMVAFEGVEKLIAQMGQDVAQAQAVLEGRSLAVDAVDG